MFGFVKVELLEEVGVLSGLVIVQLVGAVSVILVGYIMSFGINPLSLIFERNKWPTKFSLKLLSQFLLISFAGVTLFQTLMLYGVKKTSPALASIMPNLAPGFIFIIASILRAFHSSLMMTVSESDPRGPTSFICDSPIHSDVEIKLRQFLLKFESDNRLLGIQVCVYKDGQVVIDTAAGILGENDPRPVRPDSLFSSFSVTKGVAAGVVHWLVDNGKLKYDENVSNIWPGFEANGKDKIKVHHVLNHTSGLHNSLSEALTTPSLMSYWKKCLNEIVTSTPESEPGQEQLYHYASFGWLCGGIVEHASGKDFQQVLEEAFVGPLGVEGEFYIGIPPGVESRLASLSVYTEDLNVMAGLPHMPDMPSTLQPPIVAKVTPIYANLFNTLEVRRAIIPAANGHFSARALARYYATLAAGGIVPPNPNYNGNDTSQKDKPANKIFQNPKLHDAFLGEGDYKDLVVPDGLLGVGLGFTKFGSTVFGPSGLGGSHAFCDVKHQLAIAVTVNKITIGAVTAQVVEFICSEFNVPVPQWIA